MHRYLPASPWACAALTLACTAFAPSGAHAEGAKAAVKLYALDCGRAEFDDMSSFSDTGDYDGRSGKIAIPCFLIRHPKGDLLWDTGLSEQVAAQNGGVPQPGIQLHYDTPLAAQLDALGLTADDIDFVAFSHMHFDHTGGANAFTQATWLLNQRELAWATSPEAAASGNVDPSTFSAYKEAATQLIDGDYDVFGDGTVRILRTPGHTPGHQVLLLSLPKSGRWVLSGDLFHTKENERELRVPAFNTSRAETLASFDRVLRLLKTKRARLIVQHSPEDFAALPRFPRSLD